MAMFLLFAIVATSSFAAVTSLKIYPCTTTSARKISHISTTNMMPLYSSQWDDLDKTIEANKTPKRAQINSDKFPLYLGNLPFDYTSDSLKELMVSNNVVGVVSTRIVIDKKDGKSRGFGYVDFKSKDDVTNALATLSGLEINSRKIKMDAAESADGPKKGRKGGNISGDYSLFLGNIPFQLTEGDIETYVRETLGTGPDQKYDGQLKVRLAIADNRSRGFAHIDFIDNDAINMAMSKLMGTKIRDRNLIVDRAVGKGRGPVMRSRDNTNINTNNDSNDRF